MKHILFALLVKAVKEFTARGYKKQERQKAINTHKEGVSEGAAQVQANFFQMRNSVAFTTLKYEKHAAHHFIKIPTAQLIERKLEQSVASFMVELRLSPQDIPLARAGYQHVIFSPY